MAVQFLILKVPVEYFWQIIIDLGIDGRITLRWILGK
jgi:hypothetical protein